MFRLALLLAVLAPSAAGQSLTLTPRPDAEDGLPPSIRVFDVTQTGTALRASLVRAELSADDWVLEAVLSDEGGETVASFAQDAGVYAAVNGGYFGAGQSFSLVLNEGVLASPNIKALTRGATTFYPTRSAIGLSTTRQPDVAWVYDVEGVTYAYPAPSPNAPGSAQPQPTATFPVGGAAWEVETAIGGGPVLVQDGEVAITYDAEVFFGGSGVDVTTARARTAAGYTGDGLLLLVAVSESNGMTLPALAQLMVDLGAVEALNLDGGGSTAMTAGGADVVSSTRAVLSSLRLRDPAATGNEAETIFDTGDTTYRETGDWIESANAPFAGGTKSRLNKTGTGDDRAVFTLDGIAVGRYTVEAWWTPSGNRASNTPFMIYHDGTATTVRANQTIATSAGVWNTLGEFELAPGDSVVVTDDATGTGADVFVVVDALRLFGPLGTTQTERPASVTDILRVGPNPASSRLDVTIEQTRPGPFTAELVDALGRIVRRADRIGAVGTVAFDVRGLRPAVYLVRVASSAGTQVRTVTVVR